MTDETQYETMDELVEGMSAHYGEFEADYRDEYWCEIVHEDDEAVVLADHKGYELTEWGNEYGDYDEVSRHMHERARELCDYNWSASWPVVFKK